MQRLPGGCELEEGGKRFNPVKCPDGAGRKGGIKVAIVSSDERMGLIPGDVEKVVVARRLYKPIRPEKPMMYLPSGVDHLDYLEMREQVYEWFRSRKIPIWKAEFVLECLKYDLTDQLCSGLKARE